MYLPKAKPIAALIRHAEREIILPGEFGQEVNVTPEGVSECELLSKKWGSQWKKIYTSPVKRCLQTAHHIAKCSMMPQIIQSKFLGGPGVFVTDEINASPYFLNFSLVEITKRLLSPDKNPPGFCISTSAAITYLINFMLHHTNRPGIHLFITHDSILSVFLGYFFPKINIEILWPNYLESLFLYKDKTSLHLLYRSFYKII